MTMASLKRQSTILPVITVSLMTMAVENLAATLLTPWRSGIRAEGPMMGPFRQLILWQISGAILEQYGHGVSSLQRCREKIPCER